MRDVHELLSALRDARPPLCQSASDKALWVQRALKRF